MSNRFHSSRAKVGADRALPFPAGLSHHFHNTMLPDAGFAGEAPLGGHLQSMIDRIDIDVLNTLPDALSEQVRKAKFLLSIQNRRERNGASVDFYRERW